MSTRTTPVGETIVLKDGKLIVPDRPIIPFVEGDGTGPDIWRASVRVFDAAVAKAYGARARLSGTKSSLARSPSVRAATGSPTRRSRTSSAIWSALKAR